MNEIQPFVSVIMPVFNSEVYLADSIKSILSQTYKNLELIIINDGSTDSTEHVIESFNDSRIVYLKNEINLKIVKSLNKAIAIAKGNYIARMDADDISFPTRIEMQVNFLETNLYVGVVGTSIKTFGEIDEICIYPSGYEEMIISLLLFNNLAHPTIMARSEILKKQNYSEEFCLAEDYELWTRLILNHEIVSMKDVLLKYRIHPFQTDKSRQNPITNKVKFNYAQKLFNFNSQEMDIYKKFISFEMVEVNDYEEIIKMLKNKKQNINLFSEDLLNKFLKYVIFNSLVVNKKRLILLHCVFRLNIFTVVFGLNKYVLNDLIRLLFNRPPKFYPIHSKY